MLYLCAHRRRPGIAYHSQLLRRGPRFNSATPAVIADAIPSALWHLMVVHVVNARRVHIGYRAVIVQLPIVPIGSVIATTRISIAVIDATVVADVGSPITRVPVIISVVVAPPWRSPQGTDIGGHDPCARDPIISGVRVVPVPGSPNVIVAGSGRLRVIGKRGRRFRSLNRLVGGIVLIVIRRVIRIARWRWLRLGIVLLRRSEVSVRRISISNRGSLIAGRGGLTGRRCSLIRGRSRLILRTLASS
jgi:hypothetical protein